MKIGPYNISWYGIEKELKETRPASKAESLEALARAVYMLDGDIKAIVACLNLVADWDFVKDEKCYREKKVNKDETS